MRPPNGGQMKSLKSAFIEKYVAHVYEALLQLPHDQLALIDADIGLEAHIQLEHNWDGFTITENEADLLVVRAGNWRA